MKTSAFYTDITAQTIAQVSELEQVVEIVWILQGNPLLSPWHLDYRMAEAMML